MAAIRRLVGSGRGLCAAFDRNEEGVGHLERLEDSLATESVEALAANRFDDRAEYDEVEVAVDRGFSGFVDQRRTNGAVDHGRARCWRSNQRLASLALFLEEDFVIRPPRFSNPKNG